MGKNVSIAVQLASLLQEHDIERDALWLELDGALTHRDVPNVDALLNQYLSHVAASEMIKELLHIGLKHPGALDGLVVDFSKGEVKRS